MTGVSIPTEIGAYLHARPDRDRRPRFDRPHLSPAPPITSSRPVVDRAAARRTARTYRSTSAWMRAYVAGRICVAPLAVIGDELTGIRGRMLSLGCGAGVIERYVAEVNPDVEIRGLDLDPQNISVITATASHSPRVTIERQDVTKLAEPPANDAVLISDVLHHLPPATHLGLARAVERALKPGGICLIKDLDAAPRWKRRWNRVHDRIVAGPEPIHCRPIDEMAALFARVGLDLKRSERIDGTWTPYAHYVIRLHKPG